MFPSQWKPCKPSGIKALLHSVYHTTGGGGAAFGQNLPTCNVQACNTILNAHLHPQPTSIQWFTSQLAVREKNPSERQTRNEAGSNTATLPIHAVSTALPKIFLVAKSRSACGASESG
jgi:hypothetical protein